MSKFLDKLKPKNIIGILDNKNGNINNTSQNPPAITVTADDNNVAAEAIEVRRSSKILANKGIFSTTFLRATSKSSMKTVDLYTEDAHTSEPNKSDSFYSRLRRLSFKRSKDKTGESGGGGGGGGKKEGMLTLFLSKSSLRMSLRDHEVGHYYVIYTLGSNGVDIKITQQWRTNREALWWMSSFYEAHTKTCE